MIQNHSIYLAARSWTNMLLGFILITFLMSLMVSCVPSGSESTDLMVESPTVSEIAADPHCIIGIWEIENKADFAAALIPVGSFESSKVGEISTIGSAAYRFFENGTVMVEAASFQGDVNVADETIPGSLIIKMDGIAKGRYQIQNDIVIVSDILDISMLFSAVYDGEEMMADVKADGFLPLFVVPYTSALFECKDNELTLTLMENPNDFPSLKFKRLK